MEEEFCINCGSDDIIRDGDKVECLDCGVSYTKRLPEHSPLCTCSCHIDGTNIRHCFPCCNITYLKDISKEGVVDVERRHKHLKNIK